MTEQTPSQLLIEAARTGDTAATAFMLNHGADVHAGNDEALRLAALFGHTETVKLLLDHGANIHARDDKALRWSVLFGNTETAKLLKERMATPASAYQEIADRLENLTKSFNELTALVRSYLPREPAPRKKAVDTVIFNLFPKPTQKKGPSNPPRP